MQTRRERKKQATQRSIVDVSMRLFREQGFENTTMLQIADKADLAPRTLYNYFPSKEMIVSTYFHLALEDQKQVIIEKLKRLRNTKSRLKYLLNLMSQGFIEDKKLATISFLDRVKRSVEAMSTGCSKSGEGELLLQVLAWGQEQGDIRYDIPLPVIYTNLWAVSIMTIMSWLGNPEDNNLINSMEQALDLFIQGARVNK